MRKCRNCLCISCLKSCKCQKCTEKVTECKNRKEFWQINIFDLLRRRTESNAPRHSWAYYGLTKDRRRYLEECVRNERYHSIALQAAKDANESIAEYILISVKKNKSYEGIEYTDGLGRIPCGRTDFYGYRRYFYHLFNEKIKEIGK